MDTTTSPLKHKSGQEGMEVVTRRWLRLACVWGVLTFVLVASSVLWASRWRWAPALATWDVGRCVKVEHGELVSSCDRAPIALALGDAAVPGLARAWWSGSMAEHRLVVSRTLALIRTPRARDAMFRLLQRAKDKVPERDLMFVAANLGEYDDPVTDVLLFELAADKTWPGGVRRWAVVNLICNEGVQLEARLQKLIRADTDGVLAHRIIFKVGLREDRSLDHLLELYSEHPEQDVRKESRKTLEWRRALRRDR